MKLLTGQKLQNFKSSDTFFFAQKEHFFLYGICMQFSAQIYIYIHIEILSVGSFIYIYIYIYYSDYV